MNKQFKMAVNNFSVEVVKKEFLTEKTVAVDFKPVDGRLIEFVPGQFVSIAIDPQTKRSYSIASENSPVAAIELVADIVFGGPGSQFFSKTQVGDQVTFSGPMGNFNLQPEDKATVVFLATGTGVVPFRSLIAEKLRRDPGQPVILIAGFRFAKDIFWQEHFAKVARENPNFNYILTLSQPEADWQGQSGYVQTHLDPGLFKAETAFYICGGTRMVRGVAADLEARSVAHQQLHFEMF